MDGRVVDGKRFRSLREQAGLHRTELAGLIGCSGGHLKNVETAADRDFVARNQLSAVLAHRAARVFAQRLGYPVGLDDFTDLAAPTVDDEAA